MTKANIISEEETVKLFSNAEGIVICSKTFLEKLEAADMSTIGKIVADIAPYFNIYTQYINNYDAAFSLLKSLMNRSQVGAFLKVFICSLEVRSRVNIQYWNIGVKHHNTTFRG
jgi:hypothetical protein